MVPRQNTTGTPTLPPAVEAERLEIDGRAGPLGYYTAGSGAPVLLVHSINAAASAFEMRPIFEHLQRQSRSVYAVDLPGFGFSDRSDRRYDVRLYTDAIHDMLEVIRADHPGRQVDAVALSLSAEFLARAASEAPEHLRRLVLVTPTGFRKGSNSLRAAPGSTREVPGLHAVLSLPLWRDGLYGLLTRRGSIRYFLKRTFGSDAVDEELVDYDYLTAHQPGAVFAPLAFLSGRLFSRDIRNVYETLAMPVWLAHGTRGDFGDFRGADWTRRRGNWARTVFDTGALPHFERPLEFMAALDEFLGR